ncbi:MAG: hypothetical protein ABI598_00365, partial [Chloroflexota bacterium]
IVIRYRDERSGLEYLTPAQVFHERGLRLAPRAYETRVLTDFREERDAPGTPWRRLADELGDGGVLGLDDTLRDLELRPIHQALEDAVVDVDRLPDLLAAIGVMPGRAQPIATAIVSATGTASDRRRALDGGERDAMTSARLNSWLILEPLMAAFGPGIVDELRLLRPLEVSLVRRWNVDPNTVRGLAADGRAVSAAVASPRGTRLRLAAWLGDPLVGAVIGVHAWEGVDWLDGDRLAAFVDLVAAAEVIDGSSSRTAKSRATRLLRAVERAGYRVDRLRETEGKALRAPRRSGRPSRAGDRSGRSARSTDQGDVRSARPR